MGGTGMRTLTVTLTAEEYAFYTAGHAAGRLDGLVSAKTELDSVLATYQNQDMQAVPLYAGIKAVHSKLHEATVSAPLSARKALDAALSARRPTPLSRRVRNALSGALAGWRAR